MKTTTIEKAVMTTAVADVRQAPLARVCAPETLRPAAPGGAAGNTAGRLSNSAL